MFGVKLNHRKRGWCGNMNWNHLHHISIYCIYFPICSAWLIPYMIFNDILGFFHTSATPRCSGRKTSPPRKRPSKSSRVGSKSSGSKPEPPEPEKVIPKVETEVTWNDEISAGPPGRDELFEMWLKFSSWTWVVVSNMLYFHLDPWRNDEIWLAHIFQMGWFNHQLVKHCHDFGLILWVSKNWRTEVVDDIWGKLMNGRFVFFWWGGRCKATFLTLESIQMQWIMQKNCFSYLFSYLLFGKSDKHHYLLYLFQNL